MLIENVCSSEFHEHICSGLLDLQFQMLWSDRCSNKRKKHQWASHFETFFFFWKNIKCFNKEMLKREIGKLNTDLVNQRAKILLKSCLALLCFWIILIRCSNEDKLLSMLFIIYLKKYLRTLVAGNLML